jgi:hypothetical protein
VKIFRKIFFALFLVSLPNLDRLPPVIYPLFAAKWAILRNACGRSTQFHRKRNLRNFGGGPCLSFEAPSLANTNSLRKMFRQRGDK